MSEQIKGSLKYDSDKPAMQYVPGEAMEAMGHAFAYGAKKYGGNNYKISGLEISRCIGAALRHIYKFNDGIDSDQESGLNHLGHAMAAIAMAIYMQKNHPEKDDRFKKPVESNTQQPSQAEAYFFTDSTGLVKQVSKDAFDKLNK